MTSISSIFETVNITTMIPNNTTLIPFVPFLNYVNKVKIGMAVGMMLSVFIVTLIPFFVVRYLSKRWTQNRNTENTLKTFKTWMSRINCFAGGVFLSTGFMDIFVEMLESVEEAKTKNDITIEFPLGPWLTLIGFFMILIIEESVTFIKNAFFSKPSLSKSEIVVVEDLEKVIKGQENDGYDNCEENTSTAKNITLESMNHEHNEHHDHDIDEETLSRGNVAVTILMIAISIHSIFEGLALGLEKDISGASRLFLALSLHKYIIAITIGLKVSNSSLGIKMACMCSAIFAIATPLGIVLGFWVMYLEEIGNTSFSLVAAILQGIACGTFFYIVFFEILPEEFGTKHDKLLKIVSLILGFVLISLVMFFVHE